MRRVSCGHTRHAWRVALLAYRVLYMRMCMCGLCTDRVKLSRCGMCVVKSGLVRALYELESGVYEPDLRTTLYDCRDYRLEREMNKENVCAPLALLTFGWSENICSRVPSTDSPARALCIADGPCRQRVRSEIGC